MKFSHNLNLILCKLQLMGVLQRPTVLNYYFHDSKDKEGKGYKGRNKNIIFYILN